MEQEKVGIAQNIPCHLQPVARGLDYFSDGFNDRWRRRCGNQLSFHQKRQHHLQFLIGGKLVHEMILHGPEFLGVKTGGCRIDAIQRKSFDEFFTIKKLRLVVVRPAQES